MIQMPTIQRALTAASLLAMSLLVLHAEPAHPADTAKVCAAGHLWRVANEQPALAYKFTWNVKIAAVNKMLLANSDAGKFVTLDALDANSQPVDPKDSDQWAVFQTTLPTSKWQAPRFQVQRVTWIEKIGNASKDCAGLAAVAYIAPIAATVSPKNALRFLTISRAIKDARKAPTAAMP